MKIDNIYLAKGENDPYLYIEKEGKVYRVLQSPYRALKETDLREVKTPLSADMYIKHAHLFKPTESFLADLKFYGLEMETLP